MRNRVDYRQVKRIELDGRSFRSKAEVQMYTDLKARETKGEVSNIRCEVKITLLPGARNERIDYYLDFVVFDEILKHDRYIEVKGFETDKWKMKVKLWRHFGPGVLEVWKVGWNSLQLAEEIPSKAA